MNNYQYSSDRLCYPRVGCPDEKSRERNSPGTIWGGASQISLIGMHDHESNDWNAYSTFRSDFKPHLAPFANNVHGHERTRRYLINWNNYPSIGDLNNKSKPAQRVCSFCAIELRLSRINKYTKDLPNHKHQRRGVGCPTKTPPPLIRLELLCSDYKTRYCNFPANTGEWQTREMWNHTSSFSGVFITDELPRNGHRVATRPSIAHQLIALVQFPKRQFTTLNNTHGLRQEEECLRRHY